MFLNRILYDLRVLLTRHKLDESLENEMRYHLEREEQRGIERGLAPEEARRAAALAFGGSTQGREAALDVGGLSVLESLWRDVRFAVRTLRKSPLFSAAVIATLALGIGATATVFTAVNALLLRGLPFKDPNELVALWERNEKSTQSGADHEEISPANLADWQRMSRSLAGTSAYGFQRVELMGKSEPEEVGGSAVSWSHFSLLGVRTLLGRTFLPTDSVPGSEPVVVLSEPVWRRLFGADSSIVGRAVLVGGVKRTVVGVVPAASAFPRGAELWTPRTPGSSQPPVRSSHFLRVVARLRPDVTVADAQAELDVIARQLEQQYPEWNRGRRVNVVGLQEDETGSFRSTLLVLFGAVSFVMLVACANVGGLFMARSASRTGELALRMALGAGRRRIAQQLLVECTLLSLTGACIGLLVAAWGTRLLTLVSRVDLTPATAGLVVDGRVTAFTVGLALVSTVTFGMWPALVASSTRFHEALKGAGRQQLFSRRETRGRNLLVVAEVALTMILLVGAGLMVRSLVRLQQVDLGFETARLLTAEVHLPGSRYPGGTPRARVFYGRLVDELRHDPMIESASAVFMLPFGNDNRIYAFRRADRLAEDASRANFRVAMAGYFATLGVPFVSGRDFAASDSAGGAPVVVINEMMAHRFWPGESAIGKRIVIRSQTIPSEVIGIVRDMKYFGHDEPVAPEMYVPYAQVAMNDLTVIVRTRRDPSEAARIVRRHARALDPGLPLGRVATMTELVDESLAVRRFTRMLLVGFAAAGLLLSCVGLYGLVAYSVTQRTTEIGIRMALGATTDDVVGLVTRGGMRLAVAGVAAGAAGSVFLARLLDKLVFGVTSSDPIVLAGAAILLICAAVVASAVPALKAVRVNPILALRG